MKLRTKFEDEDFKFGEVVEADIVSRFNKDELKIYCKAEAGGLHKIVYHSIAEFIEEWEDVDGTNDTNMPLIKDEKIRKAVRAWAEALGVTKVYVCGIGDGKEYIKLYAQDNGVTDGRIRISIPAQDGVWIGKEYIVEELCGEEEE